VLQKKNQNSPEYEKGSWQLVDDWTQLEGLNVEIYADECVLDRGSVEITTADGAILWLALEGADSRRLIEKLPDIHVRLLVDPMLNDS
jgi:hypothetical protein